MTRRIAPERFGAPEWEAARPHLLAAVEYSKGTHDEMDLLRAVADGKATLWLGDASAVLSEVVDYPRLRAHRLWLAGGDLEELLTMESAMADEALLIGCTRQELCGRMGWQRTLRARGYEGGTVSLHRSIGR